MVFLLSFTACTFFHPASAQTNRTGNKNVLSPKQERLLKQVQVLEQQTTLFLYTVQNKQKQVQSQLQTLNLSIQRQQQVKPKKKDQAKNEAIMENMLKKKSALLSRGRQFAVLEKEISSFLAMVTTKREEVVAHLKKTNPSVDVDEYVAQNNKLFAANYPGVAQKSPQSESSLTTVEERKQQILELGKIAAELNTQIQEYKQQQQQQPELAASSEQDKKIRDLEQAATKFESQVRDYIQHQQTGSNTTMSPDREKLLQALAQMADSLNEGITAYKHQQEVKKRSIAQNQQTTTQRQPSVAQNQQTTTQRQPSVAQNQQTTTQRQQPVVQNRQSTTQIQQPVAQNRQSTTPRQQYVQQNQQTTTRRSQSSSRQDLTQIKQEIAQKSMSKEALYQGGVNSGYYVIFGSFIERDNANRFLNRLRRNHSNVVDLGNDNIFGMYRTGVGPYRTKEEAVAQRPTGVKSWVLKVETMPNTRQIAYFELYTEEN
jgi:hypothetical protein